MPQMPKPSTPIEVQKPATSRTLPTPQEFYAKVTRRDEVRTLLARLANQ